MFVHKRQKNPVALKQTIFIPMNEDPSVLELQHCEMCPKLFKNAQQINFIHILKIKISSEAF